MWIVAVLNTSLLVLVSLLLVPVDLGFEVTREDRTRGKLSARWMFGLLRKEIEVGQRDRRAGPKPRRLQREGKGAKRKRAPMRLPILARTRGFPYRCLRFLRQLLPHVRICELRLWGRVGLDDPADTGLLFAALTPVLCCLDASPTISVSLVPDFEEASLAGQASGALRLVPVRVLWILVLFLVSPETLRAARSLATRQER